MVANKIDISQDVLDSQGYFQISKLISKSTCEDLIQLYNTPDHFRKTINMSRYRFGEGEYKYLKYPLPDLICELRQALYSKIYPLANNWQKMLGLKYEYPSNLQEFLDQCHNHGQVRSTPLILKYEKGCYNTLHQDLYGSVYFPMQVILSLNDPVYDYSGGHLVLTEQRPRAQSKAIVVNPGLGDAVIIPTQYRPLKGKNRYYKVNMKHGVSEVISGTRYTLGIIFHDSK